MPAPTSPEGPAPRNTPRFDRSDLIAVIALVISILGALAALWQNSILSEQLAQATEEKQAAVWPALDVFNDLQRVDGDSASYWGHTYGIENEGVGPALIGEAVILFGGAVIRFGGEVFAAEDFAEVIARGRAGFEQVQTSTLANDVVPAGERVELAGVRFAAADVDIRDYIALIDAIDMEMCWCSVYGACWRYVEDEWPERVGACAGVDLR